MKTRFRPTGDRIEQRICSTYVKMNEKREPSCRKVNKKIRFLLGKNKLQRENSSFRRMHEEQENRFKEDLIKNRKSVLQKNESRIKNPSHKRMN